MFSYLRFVGKIRLRSHYNWELLHHSSWKRFGLWEWTAHADLRTRSFSFPTLLQAHSFCLWKINYYYITFYLYYQNSILHHLPLNELLNFIFIFLCLINFNFHFRFSKYFRKTLPDIAPRHCHLAASFHKSSHVCSKHHYASVKLKFRWFKKQILKLCIFIY